MWLSLRMISVEAADARRRKRLLNAYYIENLSDLSNIDVTSFSRSIVSSTSGKIAAANIARIIIASRENWASLANYVKLILRLKD